MRRTKKHEAFVNDPFIGNKPVEALPGIGKAYGRRLREAGFETAGQVLQHYRGTGKNDAVFNQNLHTVCNANSQWAAHCSRGLNEWDNNWGKKTCVPSIPFSPVDFSAQKAYVPQTNKMETYPCARPRAIFNDQNNVTYEERNQNAPSVLSVQDPYALDAKKLESNQCLVPAVLKIPVQNSVDCKENEKIEKQTPTKLEKPALTSIIITQENQISTNNTIKEVPQVRDKPGSDVKKMENDPNKSNTSTPSSLLMAILKKKREIEQRQKQKGSKIEIQTHSSSLILDPRCINPENKVSTNTTIKEKPQVPDKPDSDVKKMENGPNKNGTITSSGLLCASADKKLGNDQCQEQLPSKLETQTLSSSPILEIRCINPENKVSTKTTIKEKPQVPDKPGSNVKKMENGPTKNGTITSSGLPCALANKKLGDDQCQEQLPSKLETQTLSSSPILEIRCINPENKVSTKTTIKEKPQVPDKPGSNVKKMENGPTKTGTITSSGLLCASADKKLGNDQCQEQLLSKLETQTLSSSPILEIRCINPENKVSTKTTIKEKPQVPDKPDSNVKKMENGPTKNGTITSSGLPCASANKKLGDDQCQEQLLSKLETQTLSSSPILEIRCINPENKVSTKTTIKEKPQVPDKPGSNVKKMENGPTKTGTITSSGLLCASADKKLGNDQCQEQLLSKLETQTLSSSPILEIRCINPENKVSTKTTIKEKPQVPDKPDSDVKKMENGPNKNGTNTSSGLPCASADKKLGNDQCQEQIPSKLGIQTLSSSPILEIRCINPENKVSTKTTIKEKPQVPDKPDSNVKKMENGPTKNGTITSSGLPCASANKKLGDDQCQEQLPSKLETQTLSSSPILEIRCINPENKVSTKTTIKEKPQVPDKPDSDVKKMENGPNKNGTITSSGLPCASADKKLGNDQCQEQIPSKLGIQTLSSSPILETRTDEGSKLSTTKTVPSTAGKPILDSTNTSRKETEKCLASSMPDSDNFNDSGFDASGIGLTEFSNELSTRKEYVNSTPIKNFKGLNGSSTSGSYESALSLLSLTGKGPDTGENVQDEAENIMGFTDDFKRKNIELFLALLSNELEQLPMDRILYFEGKVMQLLSLCRNEWELRSKEQ